MAPWEHRLERESAKCRKTVVIITRLLVQLRFGTAGLRVWSREAGMAQPLARGFARKTGATLTLYDWALRATALALYAPRQGNRIFNWRKRIRCERPLAIHFPKAEHPQPKCSHYPLVETQLNQMVPVRTKKC